MLEKGTNLTWIYLKEVGLNEKLVMIKTKLCYQLWEKSCTCFGLLLRKAKNVHKKVQSHSIMYIMEDSEF